MSLPNFDLRSHSDHGSESGIHVSGPESTAQRRAHQRRRRQGTEWQCSLGLHPATTRTQVAALFLHATSSILFLVFLNAAQPFFITQLSRSQNASPPNRDHGGEEQPQLRLGLLTGRLAFADELSSIFLVLIWGALCDRWGLRIVTPLGYLLIALGLVAYAFASKPWPDLLWCRLTFALGASAVTAMLTASLVAYSAPSDHSDSGEPVHTGSVGSESEETPLLLPPSDVARTSRSPQRHGRLSSIAGVCTGLGAVVSVFFLLPLPVWLAGKAKYAPGADGDHDDDGSDNVLRGTRQAFAIVSGLAFLVALLLALGLDQPASAEERKDRVRKHRERQLHRPSATRLPTNDPAPPPQASTSERRQARRERLRSRLSSTSMHGRSGALVIQIKQHFTSIFGGFYLAFADSTGSLWLAYLSGALARCVTIASTLFLPLFIAHHFYVVDPTLCPPPASNHLPPSELKKTCRRAYTLTAAQTGVLQTVALVASPLVGFALDRVGRNRSPFAGAIAVLLAASLCGIAGFGTYAFGLPAVGGLSSREGDPTAVQAWIAATLLGICQIASIVGSLSLVAKCRDRWAQTNLASATTPSPSQRSYDGVGAHSDPTQSGSEPTHPRSHSTSMPPSTTGAIAGAYSSVGALSILLLGSIGGWLFDLRPQGPFEILTGVSVIVTCAALFVWTRQSR